MSRFRLRAQTLESRGGWSSGRILASVVTLSALALLLVAGLRPAAADHTPACTNPLTISAGESCWIHPDTVIDGDAIQIEVGGEYRLEAWGGGGGGGGDAGGGGGGGEWAMMELDLSVGAVVTWAIGAGGPGGATFGTAGTETTVAVDGSELTAEGGEPGGQIVGAGPGGEGGGTGIPDVTGTVKASDATIGGAGGEGTPHLDPGRGGGGGGAAGPGGNGGAGTDATASVHGDGGAGAAPGGSGGNGGSPGGAGAHPGGGGGGGGPDSVGGAGAPGAVRVTLVTAVPTVTKVPVHGGDYENGYSGNEIRWRVSVSNPTDSPITVTLRDTPPAVGSRSGTGGCGGTIGPDFFNALYSANGVTCTINAGNTFNFNPGRSGVTRGCADATYHNEVEAWLGDVATGTPLAVTYESAPSAASGDGSGILVSGDPTRCITVTKEPLDDGEDFTDGYDAAEGLVGWVITVRNEGTGIHTVYLEDTATLEGERLGNPDLSQTFGNVSPETQPADELCALPAPPDGENAPSFTGTCTLYPGDYATITATFSVVQECEAQTAANALVAYLGSNNQGDALTVGNESTNVSVPANSAACPAPELPTVTKVPFTGGDWVDGYAPGFAAWVISLINNDETRPATLLIQDEDVTFVDAASVLDHCGEASESAFMLALNGDGVTCTVAGGESISFVVASSAHPGCVTYSVTNEIIAYLVPVEGDNFALTPRYGDDGNAVTIPGDPTHCGITKTPYSGGTYGLNFFDEETRRVAWEVVLTNGGAVPQVMTVRDEGSPAITGFDVLDTAVLGACGEADAAAFLAALLGDGVECTVPAGGLLLFVAHADVAQSCTDTTEAVNSITGWLGGRDATDPPLLDVEDATDVTIDVPAADCVTPTITKTAAGWENGLASWGITVDNTVASTESTTIDRTVVIIDEGATLTASTPADVCIEVTDGWQCDVEADSTLDLTVTTSAPTGCQPYQTFNSATLYLEGDLQTVIDSVENVMQRITADPSQCSATKAPYTGDGYGADAFDEVNQQVAWTVTLENASAVPQLVTVRDAGDPAITGFHALNSEVLVACDEEDAPALLGALLGKGAECTLPANGQLSFVVYAPVAACQTTEAVNSIFGWIGPRDASAADLLVVTAATDIAIDVPGGECAPPSITKEPLGYENGRARWTITVTRPALDYVWIDDLSADGVEGLPHWDEADVDATCGWERWTEHVLYSPGDWDGYDVYEGEPRGIIVECWDGQETLTFTVYQDSGCENTAMLWYSGTDGWGDEPTQVVGPVAVEGCEEGTGPTSPPLVSKQGVDAWQGDWRWLITIDNRGEDTTRRQVELTDRNVVLQPHLDGDACWQQGDVITCTLEADERIVIAVTRDAGAATCESREAFNSIELVRVSYSFDGSWSAFESLGAGPSNVRAEVMRGEGYCLPDDYVIPLPVPSPVGDPPAAGPTPPAQDGCAIPHATWSPAPVRPGVTITFWGGGNVTEFPQPLATTYWTTVDGEWVGYVPGIRSESLRSKVNAAFFAAFPGGVVPECRGFVVSYLPPGM